MQNIDILKPPLPLETGRKLSWANLLGSSAGLAISSIINQERPLLIIAPDSLYAAHLVEELQFFSAQTDDILHFPDWETLPYDHFSPHQDILSERLATLYRAPYLKSGAIITTISTLMHRLPPVDYLDSHGFMLKIGDKLDIDVLRSKLAHAGYYAVSQVKEHGEFAVRGSIIDLYPMGSHEPYRIDLFDDEVESIQLFSPDTQRSVEKINEIQLLPAKEFPLTEESIDLFRHHWRSSFSGNPLKSPIYQDVTEGIASPGIEYYLPLFFNKTQTLFDYLAKNTLIVTIQDVKAKADEFWHEIQTRYEQARYDSLRPLLAPETICLTPEDIHIAIKPYTRLQVNPASDGKLIKFPVSQSPDLAIDRKSNEPLSALQHYLSVYDGRIAFCAETTGRREVMLQLFKSISLIPKFFSSWHDFLQSSDRHGIVVGAIEEGFCLDEPKICLLTERNFYGARIMQRRLRKTSQQDPEAVIRDLSELQIDDAVVHIDHGVGRYLGLQTLTVGNQIAEFLCLEYQGKAKLYVPVTSLHAISRYSGMDPEHAPINKLGTDQWSRAKRKAAEKVRDVAAELLDLYAKRAAKPGFSYDLSDDQYARFAADFPFEETPDQLQAIEQIRKDMASDQPMDRVICGDVGFGKTEVAIRAAFIAVMNGKQVALLVPTTLLAQQHFQNFQDRFADWPVKIELLSRFRTAKEQKIALQGLEDGKVDIVVGTHKLLQSDIKFKSLGLVVIDEEHRFGVKQKEKLKALRANVDILTMTATPIPRTLNMAFSGIRDLSIIATPPAKRLSVNTFVHEYQDHIIQEAIQRELLRGGQVYFLHNEVSSIDKKAKEIENLVREARITVAHGQMHERELERVMSDFYHRRFNVLVCSTIIESGIDIPTANTIIINRADKFGLAQLHQLRGRVGRSHHQAYAYLFTPDKKLITREALKRLEAIEKLDHLGVGFTLATHDLEIRGAGELLGEDQSGNMQAIGFSLYMELLNRAIEALKSGEEPDLEKSLLHHHAEVDLHITALIPDTYLADVQLRLQFYKRIANTKSTQELDDIQVEMIDRFGLLPPSLKNLFSIAELQQQADALGIIKIDVSDKAGKFEFNEKPNVRPETIIKLIQSQRYKLDGPTCLRFTPEPHTTEDRISITKQRITELHSA